jgi:hypothetical protein
LAQVSKGLKAVVCHSKNLLKSTSALETIDLSCSIFGTSGMTYEKAKAVVEAAEEDPDIIAQSGARLSV